MKQDSLNEHDKVDVHTIKITKTECNTAQSKQMPIISTGCDKK